MPITKTSGYALIERIIVIGVLGVVAVALLVAIDSIEQVVRTREIRG